MTASVRFRRILCALGIAAAVPLAAAVSVSPAPAKWQPMTVDCTGPTSSESGTSPNPFLDCRYQVRFTAPSGASITVPGYYDGDGAGGASGNVWRCRFLPDEEGTWSWQVSFRSGSAVAISTAAAPGSAVAGSDGLTGSFSVGAVPASAQGFFRKGRLQLVGAWYPRFQDGTWFLKAGTDSPENLFGYPDFDNTSNGLLDFAAHVGDWRSGDPTWGSGKGKGLIGAMNWLADHGVNAIYLLPMNIGGDGKDTAPYRTVASWAGSTANDNRTFDLSKLAQWRIAMEHAQRRGLLLHIVLSEGEAANKNELDGATVGTERRLYYREMSARFGDLPAVQWNVCEEYDIDLDIGPTMAKSWGATMADYDPYRHPLAVHNTGVVGTEYQQFLEAGQAFTTTSLQDRSADNHAGAVIEKVRGWAATRGGPRPVQIDEFDDVRPTTTDQVTNKASMIESRREYVWPSYFSGAAGVDMYAGGSGGYDQSLDDFRLFQDLYQWTGIAHRFVTENLPFHAMVPADSLVTGESTYGVGGSKSGGAEVLAKAGEIYAVYYPNATATGTMTLPSGTWSLRWFDPRSGVFTGSAIPLAGGTVAMPAAPSSASLDWVALITSTGGGGGNQAPFAAFSTDVTTGTAPLAVTFDAGASSDDVGITAYEWAFGDGATATGVVTSHTYAAAGTYTAVLTVRDGAGLTGTDSRTITVTAAGTNQAPVVSAGADRTITLPTSTLTLAGSVSDDGLPSASLTIQWTVQSGPGSVSFADANEPDTTATFAVAGTYVLVLTADDGVLSASDSMQVTVNAAPGGTTITAEAEAAALSGAVVATKYAGYTGSGYADYDANSGSWIEWTVSVPTAGAWTLDLRYALSGTTARSVAIAVDGATVVPSLAMAPTGAWSTWGYSPANTVTLPAGTVRIRATAITAGPNVDHLRLATSTVTPTNAAPTVSAGTDRTITLPTTTLTLAGSVSDDGLPSGSLTSQWSQVSGPGSVIFADAASPTSGATFPAAGSYVLRLTASDGALSASDDVTVTVQSAATGPAVVSLTLIDAVSNQPIAGYDPLPDGAVIDPVAVGTDSFNLRANVAGSVGSVVFDLDGALRYKVESSAPYAIAGDKNGDYYVWSIGGGAHTVTGTAWSASGGTGTVGGAVTVTFTLQLPGGSG